jgi:hypothetical protein
MHPSSSSPNPILSRSWCSSTLLVYQDSSSTQPNAATHLKISIVVEQFGIGIVLCVRVRVADFYDDTAAFRCSHCPEVIHTPEKWHRPQKGNCGKMTSPNAMTLEVWRSRNSFMMVGRRASAGGSRSQILQLQFMKGAATLLIESTRAPPICAC